MQRGCAPAAGRVQHHLWARALSPRSHRPSLNRWDWFSLVFHMRATFATCAITRPRPFETGAQLCAACDSPGRAHRPARMVAMGRAVVWIALVLGAVAVAAANAEHPARVTRAGSHARSHLRRIAGAVAYPAVVSATVSLHAGTEVVQVCARDERRAGAPCIATPARRGAPGMRGMCACAATAVSALLPFCVQA